MQRRYNWYCIRQGFSVRNHRNENLTKPSEKSSSITSPCWFSSLTNDCASLQSNNSTRIIQKGVTPQMTLKLYALSNRYCANMVSVLVSFIVCLFFLQNKIKKNKKTDLGKSKNESKRDSPGLPQVAAGLYWQVTAQCLCWWPSGQKDRPYGATCSGTSCRQCVRSPGWWAAEQFPQTSACILGTAGTRSIGVLALAWLCVDGGKCM